MARNLTDVTLMGHSMGSSVIWSYWQLWGQDRLAKLIFVDQMPMITADPRWSPQEKEDAGAIFDPTSLYDTINQLAGPDGVKTTEGFIGVCSRSLLPVRGGLGGQAEPEDAAAVRGRPPLQSLDPGLAPGHPAHHAADAGGRRPRERRALEIAGVDPEASPRARRSRSSRRTREETISCSWRTRTSSTGSSGTSLADQAET